MLLLLSRRHRRSVADSILLTLVLVPVPVLVLLVLPSVPLVLPALLALLVLVSVFLVCYTCWVCMLPVGGTAAGLDGVHFGGTMAFTSFTFK